MAFVVAEFVQMRPTNACLRSLPSIKSLLVMIALLCCLAFPGSTVAQVRMVGDGPAQDMSLLQTVALLSQMIDGLDDDEPLTPEEADEFRELSAQLISAAEGQGPQNANEASEPPSDDEQAQAPEPTVRDQAIIEAATGLTDQVQAFEGDLDVIRESLMKVDHAIWERMASGPYTAASMQESVMRLTERLTAAATTVARDPTLSSNGDIATPLVGLFGPVTMATRQFHLDGLSAALATSAASMLATGEPGYSPQLGNEPVQTSLAALRQTIIGVRGQTPAATFTTEANLLRMFIVPAANSASDADTAAQNARRSLISTSPEAMFARRDLLSALIGLEDRTSPRIHIISAVYGDLRRGASASRSCDASRTIREHCQSRLLCSVTSSSDGPRNQTNLCGFDPIPLARPENQRIEIRYACYRGRRDEWDSLARNPHIDPSNDRRFDASHPGALTARVLRAQNWTLQCAADEAVLLQGVND
ncbi:MAG: hypothetical protein ACE37E_08430 [Hyphomicrobiales bacterium]